MPCISITYEIADTQPHTTAANREENGSGVTRWENSDDMTALTRRPSRPQGAWAVARLVTGGFRANILPPDEPLRILLFQARPLRLRRKPADTLNAPSKFSGVGSNLHRAHQSVRSRPGFHDPSDRPRIALRTWHLHQHDIANSDVSLFRPPLRSSHQRGDVHFGKDVKERIAN